MGMMAVVQQTLTRVESGYEDRLGLFGGVLMEIADDLYFTVQADILQQESTTIFTDSVYATDTLSVEPLADSTAIAGSVRRLNPRLLQSGSRTLPHTSWRSQFSVGMVVRHTANGAELYLKPLVGVGRVNAGGRGLFSVRFAARSTRYGFELGGDVRGNIKGTNTSAVVYLAKSFTLQRLAEFLGS
jgi:hypothetical protein